MTAFELIISFAEHVFEYMIPSMKICEMKVTSMYNDELLGALTLMELIDCPENSPKIPSLSRKRTTPHSNGVVHKARKTVQQKTSNPKDNFTALEQDLISLNLLPELSNKDCSCKMCPYVAKQKAHLKIHYQLKHFGGLA